MVAAGRRDHAGLRHVAGQQIGERAARLERAGMLKKLELERQRMAGKAELGAIDLHHRRPPDKGPDEPLALSDHFRSYGICRRIHCNALPRLIEQGLIEQDLIDRN